MAPILLTQNRVGVLGPIRVATLGDKAVTPSTKCIETWLYLRFKFQHGVDCEVEGVDRQSTTHNIGSWQCATWPYSFALNYEDISQQFCSFMWNDGRLVVDTVFLSVSGWSWITGKCHLLIKTFLRFCKVGWYVVTKGRIFFRTSLFFCKADFRSVNLTSEAVIGSCQRWFFLWDCDGNF